MLKSEEKKELIKNSLIYFFSGKQRKIKFLRTNLFFIKVKPERISTF